MSNTEQKALNALVKGLVTYLETNLPEVDGVIEGFPSPSDKLDYPCASVFLKAPSLRLHSPYTVSKTAATAPEKSKVLRAYGYYDVAMQVDLWSDYRPKLQELMENFVRLFNPETEKTGIFVTLSEYHDQKVTYSLTGDIQLVEGEEASQRNEWRAIATVQTGVRAIKEHLEYLMNTIENNLETPDEIEAGEDPDYFGVV